MKYMYIPHKLIDAKEDIIYSLEKKKNDGSKAPGESLLTLVSSLVALDKEVLKMHAITLSNYDVERIAAYIPFNYYKVKMDNLFEIFKIRKNWKLCETLYYTWQDSYDNSECNDFILRELMTDKDFTTVLLDCNYTEDIFYRILKSGDVVDYFGRVIAASKHLENMSLEEKLYYWRIRKDSKLYRGINSIFYTFCNRQDLLSEPEKTLLKAAKRFVLLDDGLIKRFIVNLLTRLTLEDLQQFNELAEYLVKQTGDVRENRFKVFFEGVDSKLVKKYKKWLKTLEINGILSVV